MRRKRRDKEAMEIKAVPWWVWAVAAAIVWLLGQLLTGASTPAKGPIAAIALTNLLKGIGYVVSWVFPIPLLLLAVIAAVRQARVPRWPSGDPMPDCSPGIEPHWGSPSHTREADGRIEPRWGRSKVDSSQWGADLINTLEWKRIEQLAAIYFRTLKFRVEEAAPGPDGGVDLRLYATGAKTPGVLVQCKAWKSWQVGVDKIRELFGVMAAEGVNEGIFLTTSTFTRDAVEFARGKNIVLIDGADLLRKLLDLPGEDQEHILATITAGDYTTPTCPSCGIKMVTRVTKASGEAFWGCTRYPKCRSTIQIGRASA